MTARSRKLIGAIALIAFVCAYSLVAMALAQSRPLQEAPALWQALGYGALGLFWTLPAAALIKWLQRPDPVA